MQSFIQTLVNILCQAKISQLCRHFCTGQEYILSLYISMKDISFMQILDHKKRLYCNNNCSVTITFIQSGCSELTNWQFRFGSVNKRPFDHIPHLKCNFIVFYCKFTFTNKKPLESKICTRSSTCITIKHLRCNIANLNIVNLCRIFQIYCRIFNTAQVQNLMLGGRMGIFKLHQYACIEMAKTTVLQRKILLEY